MYSLAIIKHGCAQLFKTGLTRDKAFKLLDAIRAKGFRGFVVRPEQDFDKLVKEAGL